jgi:hypothetical protein
MLEMVVGVWVKGVIGGESRESDARAIRDSFGIRTTTRKGTIAVFN